MKSRREMTRQTVMMKNSVVIIDSAPWPAFRNAAARLPEPDNTNITIINTEAQGLNAPKTICFHLRMTIYNSKLA